MFGVIAIDKPAGWTSRDVVNRVHRWARPHKVGHTGTLDPLATGVLLVGVGRATRLVEFSHESPKAYVGEFLLGKRSDSLDIESEVECLANAPHVTREQIDRVLDQWTGTIEQVPPKYSAVQINGRRAYDLARQGKEFEIPTRKVQIHSLSMLEFNQERQSMLLSVQCSSGTYIRTLGSDIAKSVGSDAVMSSLRRTAIGSVRIEDCCQLDEIQSSDELQDRLLSPLCLVESLPKCVLSDEGAVRIRNGIAVAGVDFVHTPAEAPGVVRSHAKWAALDTAGALVAILRADADRYRSLRVFHSTSDTHHPITNSTKQIPES